MSSPLAFAPDGRGDPVAALQAGWGLACTACDPVGGGFVHRSFRVETAPGEHLLLQELNRHFFHDLDALAANVALVGGVLRTPARVRPTTTGRRWFADDDGRGWRLMTWIEGTVPASPAGGPAVAARLGTAFARFHRDVSDLDPERLHMTIPAFHDPAGRVATLLDLVRTDPHDRLAGSEEAVDALHRLSDQKRLVEVAGTWREPAVPTRVAHLDATPDNVLVDECTGEVVAVIDLDTAMPSSWLWDVGELLRSACTTPAEVFDPAAADALLDAYRAEIADLLTPAELDALPRTGAVVAYEQAVRFVSDHLDGDRYYAVSRPGENLERARLQLSLLGSMQEYADRKAHP